MSSINTGPEGEVTRYVFSAAGASINLAPTEDSKTSGV